MKHVAVARCRAEKVVRHHVHQRLQRAALTGGFGGFALSLVGSVGLELCLEFGLGAGWKLGSGLDDVDNQQADGHSNSGGGYVEADGFAAHAR